MTEYFDVIDKNDKVIGKASRDECHTKGLMHRAIHIIIINSKGEILLQKRSMKKDLYPGWWIDAAAGHVDSGETYYETAKRELKEELGIEIELKELFDIKREWKGDDKIDNEHVKVYLGYSNGPFVLAEDEIDFVKFFRLKYITKMMKNEKFTPITVAIFNELMKRPELLKRLDLS